MSGAIEGERNAPQIIERRRRFSRKQIVLLYGLGTAALICLVFWRNPVNKPEKEDKPEQSDIRQVVAPEIAPAAASSQAEVPKQSSPPQPPQAQANPAVFNMMPPQTEKHVRMLSFALPAQQQQREAQADPPASRAAMPTGGNPGATSIAYKGTQIPVAKAGAANDTTLWLMPGIYHCVLDTAVSSEISGPFMCHVSEAIRSDAGAVLMERGTRIVGQYQSEIHQGQSRIPTLAVTAWTPNGVPVPLNSSMADGLGRVGMDGEVNNHYLQRFGSSVLLLLTQGALGAAQAALQHGNNNTYLQTGGFESAATEALRNSINIPPTITKNQGEDVAFFVTMPVDFSAAYELHVAR